MNEFLKEKITEVKEERLKTLMGLELDLSHFNTRVKAVDVEGLKKELSDFNKEIDIENAKVVLDEKKEKIVKDNRDQDKLEKLRVDRAKVEKQIDQVKADQDEADKRAFLLKEISAYVNLLDNIPPEVLAKMEAWAERK